MNLSERFIFGGGLLTAIASLYATGEALRNHDVTAFLQGLAGIGVGFSFMGVAYSKK